MTTPAQSSVNIQRPNIPTPGTINNTSGTINNTSGTVTNTSGTVNNVPTNQTMQTSRVSNIVHRLTFSSETVKRLTSDDFDLNSRELIGLKYDDCILILFHVENTESYQLADIWALAAQQIAGPIFAAINMLSERRVAEAFTRLKSDGSHPLHWASLRQYPFIMVYRGRWPVAVYNGPREVQAIIDYALTLACEAGYYEIIQLGGSMQSDSRAEMGPYDVYTNIPGQPDKIRKESLQYTADNPIRGFNPNIGVTTVGATGTISNITTTTQPTTRAQITGEPAPINPVTTARPTTVSTTPIAVPAGTR